MSAPAPIHVPDLVGHSVEIDFIGDSTPHVAGVITNYTMTSTAVPITLELDSAAGNHYVIPWATIATIKVG